MGRQDRPQTDTVGDMTSVDAGEGLPTLGKLELSKEQPSSSK